MSFTLVAQAGLSHAAEANMWEERRRAVSSQAGAPAVVASLPSAVADALSAKPAPVVAFPEHMVAGGLPSSAGLPAPLRNLPLSLGEVVGVHSSAARTAPFVVLIQDAHQVLSAQRSIDGILSHLQPAVIGIEGAAGDFLIAPYRRLPGQEIQRDIAHALFEKNLLTGAEHYGLTGEKEALFRGLEDPALYMENVDAYRRGLAALPAADPAVRGLQAALDGRKEAYFSPALKAFDKLVSDHEARRLSLTDYVGALTASLPVDVLRRFPQASLFRESLALERSLDMPAVQRERAELAELLARSLPPQDLQALVQASAAARAGHMGPGAYHDTLRKCLAAAGVAQDRYKAFGAYVRYALTADRVRPAGLFDELEGLKSEAARRLARSAQERALFAAQQDLRLVHGLLRHELTADQWRAYETRRQDIARLPALLGAPQAAWPEPLSSFEDFYRAAARRDDVLAERFLSTLSEKKSSDGVLIAGGFHSAGLQRALGARGASVVTLTPRIEELPENPTSYLDIFGPNRTPLEKMLLGDRLTTNPPPALAAVLIDPSFKHSQAPNVLYRVLTKLLNGAAAAALGMKARWSERNGVRSATEGDVTALTAAADTPAFRAAAARLAGDFRLTLEQGVVAVGRHKVWPAAAAAGAILAWAARSLWSALGAEAAVSGAAVPVAVQAGAALSVLLSLGVIGLAALGDGVMPRSSLRLPRPVRKALAVVSVAGAVACGSPMPAAAPVPMEKPAAPAAPVGAADAVRAPPSPASAPTPSPVVMPVAGRVDLRLSDGAFLWFGKPATVPAFNWRVLGNYGSAFGYGNVKGWFKTPQGVDANAAAVDQALGSAAHAGVKMVRLWLLDDGRAILDRRGRVAFFDETFKRDVRTALDLALKHGIAVQFSLLDYLAAGPAKNVNGVWVQGRGAVLTDPAVRKAFVDDFVVPFMQNFGDHPALVAIDTGNEFEWLLSAQDGGDHLEIPQEFRTPKPIPLKDILAYHNAVSAAIRRLSPRVLVVGPFNSAKHSNLWKNLKGSVDYIDAHIYAHKWGAPLSAWMDTAASDARALGLPVALGEYSTAHEDPAEVGRMAHDKNFLSFSGWNLQPSIDNETANDARLRTQLENLRALVTMGGGAFTFLLLAGGLGVLMGASGFQSAQIASFSPVGTGHALVMLGLLAGVVLVRRGALRKVGALFPALMRRWRGASWPLRTLLLAPLLLSIACGGRSDLLPGAYLPPDDGDAANAPGGWTPGGEANRGGAGGWAGAGAGQAGQSPIPQGGHTWEAPSLEDPVDSSFVVDGTAYHHRPGYNFSGNVLDLGDDAAAPADAELFSGLPWQIVVMDGHHYLFSADGLFNIHIFNVDDPASPQLVGTVNLGNKIHSSFTVFRDRIYVVSEKTQGQGPVSLLTYDISSPAAPRFLGTCLLPFFPYTMEALDGSSLVIGEHPETGPARLVVLDTRNPSDVKAGQPFAPAPPPLEQIRIDRALKRLYVLATKELQIWDLANPAVPRRLSVLGGLPIAQDFDVHVQDGKTYVITTSEGGEGIMLVDATNPAAPSAVLRTPFKVRIQGRDIRVMQVRAEGHTLHAGGRATMTMGPNSVDDFSVHMELDILNPSAPRLDKVIFLDGAPAGYDPVRDVSPKMDVSGPPMASVFMPARWAETWAPRIETWAMVGGIGVLYSQLAFTGKALHGVLLPIFEIHAGLLFPLFLGHGAAMLAAYVLLSLAIFFLIHLRVLREVYPGRWERRWDPSQALAIAWRSARGIHLPLLWVGLIAAAAFAGADAGLVRPWQAEFAAAIFVAWAGRLVTARHLAYNRLALGGRSLDADDIGHLAWLTGSQDPSIARLREVAKELRRGKKEPSVLEAERDRIVAAWRKHGEVIGKELGIIVPMSSGALGPPEFFASLADSVRSLASVIRRRDGASASLEAAQRAARSADLSADEVDIAAIRKKLIRDRKSGNASGPAARLLKAFAGKELGSLTDGEVLTALNDLLGTLQAGGPGAASTEEERRGQDKDSLRGTYPLWFRKAPVAVRVARREDLPLEPILEGYREMREFFLSGRWEGGAFGPFYGPIMDPKASFPITELLARLGEAGFISKPEEAESLASDLENEEREWIRSMASVARGMKGVPVSYDLDVDAFLEDVYFIVKELSENPRRPSFSDEKAFLDEIEVLYMEQTDGGMIDPGVRALSTALYRAALEESRGEQVLTKDINALVYRIGFGGLRTLWKASSQGLRRWATLMPPSAVAPDGGAMPLWDPLDPARPASAERLTDNLHRIGALQALRETPRRVLSQGEVRRALWDLFTGSVGLESEEDISRIVNALRQEPAHVVRAAADFTRSREDFESQRWLSPLLETMTALSDSRRDAISQVNEVMEEVFGMNRVRGELNNLGTAYVEARGAEADAALLTRVAQLLRAAPDGGRTVVYMVVNDAVLFRRVVHEAEGSVSRSLIAGLGMGRLVLVEQKGAAALNPLTAIRRAGGETAVQSATAGTLTVLAANPSLLDLTGLGQLVHYLIQLINGQTLQVPAGKMGEVIERDRKIKQFA